MWSSVLVGAPSFYSRSLILLADITGEVES